MQDSRQHLHGCQEALTVHRQWYFLYDYYFQFIYLLYQAGSGVALSKTKLLRYLLEGTAGANAESIGDEEKDAIDGSTYDYSAGI